MTQDEGIEIAVRLGTAIFALKEAYELAEKTEGAPVESIRGALATVMGCRLACLEKSPVLKSRLLL